MQQPQQAVLRLIVKTLADACYRCHKTAVPIAFCTLHVCIRTPVKVSLVMICLRYVTHLRSYWLLHPRSAVLDWAKLNRHTAPDAVATACRSLLEELLRMVLKLHSCVAVCAIGCRVTNYKPSLSQFWLSKLNSDVVMMLKNLGESSLCSLPPTDLQMKCLRTLNLVK